jgi:hypothetical protein
LEEELEDGADLAKGRCIGCSIGIVLGPLDCGAVHPPTTAWVRNRSSRGSLCGDIGKFYGNVTRGEGRILLCMQSYDDQIGLRMSVRIVSASRNLEQADDGIERIADACWN